MTVVTTRPNSTTRLAGATVVGAATGHAALSDDVDTSYVQMQAGDDPSFKFAEPVIPAGAKVKTARMRARTRKQTDKSRRLQFFIVDPSDLAGTNILGLSTVLIGWSSPTTSIVCNDQQQDPHVAPTDLEGAMQSIWETDGSIAVYALYMDVVYVVQPVPNIVAPTGTLTGDSTPTVQWTDTLDEDGGAQTKFEVKIFTDAVHSGGGFNPNTSTAVQQSGILEGTDRTWTMEAPLANGTFWSYVRIAQTVNGQTHWSNWDNQSFIINIARPATPTMSLTPDNPNGRIQISLSDNAGAATTDLFEVDYSDDVGETWHPVRTTEGTTGQLTPDEGGNGVIMDYEAGNGLQRRYRARAVHLYADGNAYSAYTQDGATWTGPDWWVKHPTNPTLNMVVTVRSQTTSTRTSRQSSLKPIGARYPIVVQDVRSAPEGQLILRFSTDAERDRFEELLGTSAAFLVQAPPTVVDWPERWVAFGDYERERAIDTSWGQKTFDSVPWTEITRPLGALGTGDPGEIIDPPPLPGAALFDVALFDVDVFSV